MSKTAYTSQIPLKSQGLQEPTGEGLPLRKSSSLENGFDTQVSSAVCWGGGGGTVGVVVVMGDFSWGRDTDAWRGYYNVLGERKHTLLAGRLEGGCGQSARGSPKELHKAEGCW